MKVAVVGGGICGLASAHALAISGVNVVLYEKEDRLGGHAKTVNVDGVDIDLGFFIFNGVTYPNMVEVFKNLAFDMKLSEMSFSVSLDKGHGCEWGTRNGFSSLFAQKKNLLSPYFWQMLREIVKFKDDVNSYLDEVENNPNIARNESLGEFIISRGYSELFLKAYLIPICASIYSYSSGRIMDFSAFSVLSYCRNHHLLEILERPQFLTGRWGSNNLVKKVKEELQRECCQIKTDMEVHLVSTSEKGCVVYCKDGSQELYDGCIMAVDAPHALRLLGDEATYDEQRILGAFQYSNSDIFLHRDKSLMPQNLATWSAWNFLGSNNKICVTYWLNILQNIEKTSQPFFVTPNPYHIPEKILFKWSTSHPIPSVAAFKASLELDHIQGKRKIWFSGAYQGYGFHEDGIKAAMIATQGILGRFRVFQTHPKHMVPSWKELGARTFLTRFLSSHITIGCLILLEDGGTMFTFEATRKASSPTSVLRVHNPQFYWKFMTQGELGLAEAYINADFSFVDKDEGLLNFFLILISINNSNQRSSKSKNRGWWSPIFWTSTLASSKYFMKHLLRRNTITQARINISEHYDKSNDFFATYLGETMAYSSAIFKNKDEDLNIAQRRKISLLIEKAKIDKTHELLDIGCGWGSVVIEAVKQTGCKCTGITLSKEQLKLAEKRVKDLGLQDRIKFLLCDYRELPKTHKYDRIISCEMIEHVGHEYMEEFFACCDSALADNGIFVLQFISIRDELYDEKRLSPGFLKEYIFPGGLVPSLSRVTSAMAAASKLCVDNIESIGIHYFETLRRWRKNFLERQSEIMALGFDEKTIRTWEFYFDNCAAGFKSGILGDYQVVFSRPDNVA